MISLPSLARLLVRLSSLFVSQDDGPPSPSKSRLPPKLGIPSTPDARRPEKTQPPRRSPPKGRYHCVLPSSKAGDNTGHRRSSGDRPPAASWARRHLPIAGRLRHVGPSPSTRLPRGERRKYATNHRRSGENALRVNPTRRSRAVALRKPPSKFGGLLLVVRGR